MDLDLHLYICGECEVFYNVRNCLGANLAADITNGLGPETITIDNTKVCNLSRGIDNCSVVAQSVVQVF